jgi:rod shape-determining protein MreC
VLLSVLALLFISLDFAGGSLGGARGGVTGALGSMYRGTDSVLGPARRFVQGVPDVGTNRRKIAQLQQQNRALQQQLTAAATDASTAKQLKALQLQADSANWSVRPARVIATGVGAGFQWTVTLDVGSQDHVLLGQTVTDGFALVGRLISVHPATSVVLLTADPTSGVGVRDTRSGELLLATGAGAGGLTASPLDEQNTVKPGDKLVTGPAGKTTYTAGIQVGVVTSVHTSAAGVFSAQVRPSAGLTQLDLVGVIAQTPRDTARGLIVPTSSR